MSWLGAPPVQDELPLVRRAQAGDRSSFERLLSRHSVWLYNAAWGVVSGLDADDLYQDIVVHLLQNLPSFQGRSKFSTWLRRVVRNFSLNWVRARKAREVVPLDPDVIEGFESEDLSGEGRDPAAIYETVERERLLRSAISHLSETAQRALTLRYSLEMDYASIAACLNSTPDAARMLVNRSLQALAKDPDLRRSLYEDG